MEPAALGAEVSPVTAIRLTALRRWPVVLLVAAVAVAAAAVAVARRDASYEATAKLLIAPLPQYDATYFGTHMIRDAGDPKLTAATAADVLHSRDIAAEEARRLGDGTTADTVLDTVEVRPATETNVLAVVASADSRARAERLASLFVSSALAVRARLVSADLDRRIANLSARRQSGSGSAAVPAEQLQAVRAARQDGTDPTVQVAQLPGPAKASSQAPAGAVLALAVLGGLFLGVLAAVGVDRLAGRVRDEQDALAIYNLPVWARVPAAPRRLRREGPIAPSRMTAAGQAAMRSLSAQIGRWSPQGGAFAVISPTDGDGRTTTAVGVAAALAARGRGTALVLLDPLADGTAITDLRAAGVDVVSADGEGSRPLSETLESARQRADVVVIDGPPFSRGADVVAVAVSSELVLAVQVRVTSRHQLRQLRDVLEEIGARPAGLVLVGTGAGRRGAPRGAAAAPAGASRDAPRSAPGSPDPDAPGARWTSPRS